MKPYYEQNGITLYCGKAEEVMPTLEPTFDLVFTSPPYNLGVTTGGVFPDKKRVGHYSADSRLGKRGGMGKWQGAALANGYDGHDDAMPPAEYAEWQRSILRQCWSLLTDKGAIYYQHKPRVQDCELLLPLEFNPGLPLRQIIIWARAGGINFAPTHYVPTHEWIVVLAKPDFRLKSKGASGVGDVWYVPQVLNNWHPAAFPVELPATALETTGAARVLDPFCGSGTTLRAAKDAGVEAVGIEKSEDYCAKIVERLEPEQFTGVLFGAA